MCPVDGGTSGASSDTTAPPLATIASARRACVAGPTRAWPPPMTATVVPLARSVASWAAPSIPNANPDTTVASAAASAVAIRTAVDRPAPVARRVPTTATARARDIAACRPRRYRTCGGIAIAARRAGYDGSSTVTTPTPSARSRPTMRSARCAASAMACATGSMIGRSRRPISAPGVAISRSTPADPDATVSTSCAEP